MGSGRRCEPSSVTGPDWTIAIDDALCERYTKCVLCLGPTYSMDAFVVQGIVLAVSRCRRCAAQDPKGLRVLEQLGKREETRRR